MELNCKKSDYFSDVFMEYVTLFFETEAVSQSSMLSYMSRLRTLCDTLGKDFLDITEDDADRYFSNLRTACRAGKCERSSVYSKWTCYNRIGGYIERQMGGDYSNPFSGISLELPSSELVYSRIPTMDDVDKILSKVPNRTYYLVFVLAFRTALSVSEIVRLKVSSFVKSEDKLLIQTQGHKSRLLPLPEDVANLVEGHMASMSFQDEEGHLFYNKYNNALHAVNVRQCFKSILDSLNLDATYSIKDLRNRCILDMLSSCDKTEDDFASIGDYVGLGDLRLRTLEKSASLIRKNPTEMVNIRVNEYVE